MISKIKIHWGAILFTVVNAIILAGTVEIYPIPKVEVTLSNHLSIDYADFIVILLTCLGVLIAALTLFIAILAFVGLRQMKVTAMNSAEEHVKKSISEDDGDLNCLVKKAAASSAEEHVKKSISEDDGDLNHLVKDEVKEVAYQHLSGTSIADDWPENDENGEA